MTVAFIHYIVIQGLLGQRCLDALELKRQELKIGNSQIYMISSEEECKLGYKSERSNQ